MPYLTRHTDVFKYICSQLINIHWQIIMFARYLWLFIIIAFTFSSCGDGGKEETNQAFTIDSTKLSEYDLPEIEEAGEIIIAIMYGPETYYSYHGKSTGLAYDLISNYASTIGLRIRVEPVKDTASLFKMLASGEADVIAIELPTNSIRKHGFIACGAYSDSSNTGKPMHVSWAVRKNQPELAQSLNQWYNPDIKQKLKLGERKHIGMSAVRRKVRAPYLSRAKGIISQYDTHFMQGSRLMGWDWRLIAAQCYQESGFDPRAVSWAGAKGLMQIIPSTAKLLGIKNIYDPAENIDAGCRYLKQLQEKFKDVRNRNDKICFTLAAYNGGYHHIRDAMNLARKNGKNPYSWNDVRFFVRNLDKPQYYNDPVVKNGFMIGSETYNYVESILQRWSKYRDGKPVSIDSDMQFITPQRSKRKNRFTKPQEIIILKDSI